MNLLRGQQNIHAPNQGKQARTIAVVLQSAYLSPLRMRACETELCWCLPPSCLATLAEEPPASFASLGPLFSCRCGQRKVKDYDHVRFVVKTKLLE